jgi:anti-anti-sigma factor
MDIDGASQVDLRMNLVAAKSKAIVIDMERVSFLGSMGLRSLVIPARSIKSRGGKVVLLRPNTMVRQVLVTSGIDKLIPIFEDLDNAAAALR